MGLLGIGKLLKGVPWQVYAGVLLLSLLPVSYCKGRSDGKQVILERLEKAEAKAEKKAEEARDTADEKAQERAEDFEAEQETLRDAIIDAEAYDDNPLDNLF